MIWAYDVKEMCQKQIPIETVCFETDLYELKDASNNIVEQNKIEKALSRHEKDFSEFIETISKRAKLDGNLNTSCFLTANEKAAFIGWMCLQISRYPTTISSAEEVATEMALTNDEPNSARNYAIERCLDLFFNGKIDKEKPGLPLHIGHWFKNKAFVIGRSSQPLLFTSDSPVYLLHTERDSVNFNIEGPQKIIFPLSSTLALFMLPYDKENCGRRNILIDLSEDNICEVQWSMACSAKRWIFSSQQFTDKQIALIKSAREDKHG